MTLRRHKEACRCPFDNLVSPVFFEHKGPQKLLNFRITDSWRQIMHSDECTTEPILHKLEKKAVYFNTLRLQ